MAFSLTQRGSSVYNSGNVTTLSPTITSTATSGNLLLCAVSVDKDSGGFSNVSGWSKIESTNTDVSICLYYKVSDGTENGCAPAWTSSHSCQAWVEEWEGFTGSPTLDVSTSNYESSAVTTCSTGTTSSTSYSTEFAFAINGH